MSHANFRPTLTGLEARDNPADMWWMTWWSYLTPAAPSTPDPVIVSPPVSPPPAPPPAPVVVSPPPAPVSPPVVAPPPVVAAPPPVVAPSLPALNQAVVNYATSMLGSTVDPANGADCYDFAAAALRAVGAVPQWQLGTDGPIGNHYSWGTLVYRNSMVNGYANAGSLAGVKAGDIIQMEQYYAVAPNGAWASASHHTAVVKSVDASTGVIQVWQQNWNGQKYVTEGQYNLSNMKAGLFSVYRPTY